MSFVERANPAQVSKNALFRWYFVPDYQCVRVSDDNLAMELVGDGVKLVGEDELVGANGGRQAAVSRGNRASQAFVLSFTKKYAELAERSPVYAELRNVIDLSVVAAYNVSRFRRWIRFLIKPFILQSKVMEKLSGRKSG